MYFVWHKPMEIILNNLPVISMIILVSNYVLKLLKKKKSNLKCLFFLCSVCDQQLITKKNTKLVWKIFNILSVRQGAGDACYHLKTVYIVMLRHYRIVEKTQHNPAEQALGDSGEK